MVALGEGLKGLELGVGLRLGLGCRPGLGGLVQLGLGQAGNGEQLVLLVGVKVCLAVEVDGQVRNPQDGLVHLDELLDKGALPLALPDQHAAGHAQIAIEPAVPNAAAVRLDADLQVAVRRALADGLDAETGRVGVGADHTDGVSGLPEGADGEGHDRGAVARQVVLATGLDRRGPVVALPDAGEAGGLEEGCRVGDGMVC